MTHDELLGRLQDPIAWMQSESESDRRYSEETYNELKRHLDVYLALRAVVKLHKPYDSTDAGTLCRECVDEGSKTPWYPCPTVQAIIKELG